MKKGQARFILIGHSNGGLVSRYYIENMGGDVNVDKLITIDTPHYGSELANKSAVLLLSGVDTDFLNLIMPLDFELRPNSSLFTKKVVNIYEIIKNAMFELGAVSPLTYYILGLLGEREEIEYIQDHQSPKLKGNTNKKIKTNYYAIGGISVGATHGDKQFGNQFMVVEFEPVYITKKEFEDSLVNAEKSAYPNAKYYPNITETDNVVELPSQLGVRFDGESVLEYVAFKRMTIIAHDGTKDNMINHFHGNILDELRLYEVLNDYILD
ncbi:MAG: alpha/beta hydrolase [Oscillospiraceae bacterium]|nr:alpha/beta hydrolase [Oscillospiraceae bacterium]